MFIMENHLLGQTMNDRIKQQFEWLFANTNGKVHQRLEILAAEISSHNLEKHQFTKNEKL